MMNKNVPVGFHNAVTEALKEVENMNSQEKSKNKVLRTAMAVLIAAVLLSCTAFACNEILNIWFEKTGNYSGKIVSDKENTATAPEFVSFELGYLPEGMKLSETEAPYKYDYNGGFGLSFNFRRTDSLDKNEYKNIASTEKTLFGSNRAEILTVNDSDIKIALIYFENIGVVTECYFNSEIEFSEIKKILESLTVFETTKENAVVFDGTNELTSSAAIENTIDTEKIYKQGEACLNGYDPENNASFSIKVLKSEILDNVSSIDVSSIKGSFDYQNVINDDGSLKDYVRENIIYGDGVNTVDTVESTETVGRRVVAVTYEIENLSDIKGEMPCSFYLRNKNSTYFETEVFALSGQDGNNERFYFVELDANATKTVTIYFVVDEDINFNDLYMVVRNFNINVDIAETSLMKLEF